MKTKNTDQKTMINISVNAATSGSFYCIIILLLLSPSYQAYSAALQTQWQWVKQLCVCVEQHLKDNTAYFQVKQIF